MIVPELKDLNKYKVTENYISFNYPEFHAYIIKHYPADLVWTEKLYWYYHNIKEYPKCPVCGNKVKYKDFNRGYHKYCSSKCVANSESVKEKTKQTNLEKYGAENPFASKEIKEKIKETNLKNLGVEYPTQSNEVKEKLKKTNLERYGCEWGLSNENIKEKRKQTNLERYGVENPFESEEIKEKIKQTNLEKYGVEYPGQSEEIKEKIKQSNLEKYGEESPLQNPEILNKVEQTNLKKYGYKTPFQSEKIKEKIKQSTFDHFGVEHPSQSPEVLNKMKQTCIERYGEDNYSKTEGFLRKSYQTKKKNLSFNSSKIEEEFSIWLTENNISFIRQYRSDRYPFSCDFYFPDKDLYLEIQGSWTHGDHPFNLNNPDDKKTLEFWKSKNTEFYNNAINVWTIKDPLKRETAKKNNLNWIEVFSCDLNDIIEEFNSQLLCI